MGRLEFHCDNGAIGPNASGEPTQEPQRGNASAEGERVGDGRIVVTMPDGTILTLIGAARLVLAFSDWIDREATLAR